MKILTDIFQDGPSALLILGVLALVVAVIGSIRAKGLAFQLPRIWQRITIALLGLALIVGGIILSGTPSQESPSQCWISVKRVVAGNQDARNQLVRVTANVNGVSYSFPSKLLFAEFGSEMGEEKYPLALTGENYKISFTALVASRETPLDPSLLETNGFRELNAETANGEQRSVRLFPLTGGGDAVPTNYYVHYAVSKGGGT